jgi:hypothetical protein
MPALTKLYEHHAKDCAQAAGRTDNPKHRERLLKLAYEWAQAAARRASTQTTLPSTDARSVLLARVLVPERKRPG